MAGTFFPSSLKHVSPAPRILVRSTKNDEIQFLLVKIYLCLLLVFVLRFSVLKGMNVCLCVCVL